MFKLCVDFSASTKRTRDSVIRGILGRMYIHREGGGNASRIRVAGVHALAASLTRRGEEERGAARHARGVVRR